MVEQKKLAIVGTGLIGGSIGLALEEKKAPFQIVGHDRELAVAQKAKSRGALDKVEWNLLSALEGAAVVIIATPLPGVREIFEKGRQAFLPGAILTDTAPAKVQILRWAKELLPEGVYFIGGDPIVQETGKGIEAARGDLFQGSTWCLVPSPDANPDATQFVVQLVQDLGAEPFFMDAAEHDGQVAAVEHLPPLLAAALFRVACHSPAWRDMVQLVSSTFHRATELSGDDPEALSELSLANPENLSRWIDLLIVELEEMQELLAKGDRSALTELFRDPTADRDKWLAKRYEDRKALAEGLEEAKQVGSLGMLFGFRPRRKPKE